jgi:hypothetical protein
MSNINNVPDNFDLASGRTTIGTRTGVQPLWAGEAPIMSDSAPGNALFAKYELAALDTTAASPTFGKVVKFVPGTHNATQAVVVQQPITAVGQQVPYWSAGYFNHAALVWPAGVTLDTYPERKAFFTGTQIRVGHVI